MKDTITLAELRKTELYRKEQTRPLREFLMENIDVLKLADEVEMWGEDLLALNMKGGIPVIEGAKMLRQQAKELDEAGHMIGVLREQLQEEIQARADALDDLNSRMMKFMKSYNEMAWKLEEVGGAYTHPVKELTDEEIEELQIQHTEKGHFADTLNVKNFARAILRKAQEK
jgi:cell fate (sporulation/competence/biofilm development) regulator YlbF (YheA/YmcA/DUF963 family)